MCMYDRSKLRTWYIHAITDDKKEDSFCTGSCVEACQQDWVEEVWRHEVDEGTPCFYSVITDGAGCYSCLHQLLFRIDMSRRTHVYIKAFYIPETGFNKTALDGRFATDGKGVMAYVKSGTEAYDATTLFWALTAMGTAENVATLLVETNRDMQRTPMGTINEFNISSIASKKFEWVPPTIANRLTLCEDMLRDTLSRRKFLVSKVNTLLEHHRLPVRGKKNDKVDALVEYLSPQMLRSLEKGWSAAEVVQQMLLMQPIRDDEEDNVCCRLWVRAIYSIAERPAHPSSEEADVQLQIFLNSLIAIQDNGEVDEDSLSTQDNGETVEVGEDSLSTQDNGETVEVGEDTDGEDSVGEDSEGAVKNAVGELCVDEIVLLLLRYRFVAPKLTQSEGLMLKRVVFRRQSGIGQGFTLSAARLESLWGGNPTDRTYSTGVRVLENSRRCGMYNAPIVKHESQVVRTRASKVNQRVEKAQRARRRLEEQSQLHEFVQEGIKARKLLSDGYWCRLPGCSLTHSLTHPPSPTQPLSLSRAHHPRLQTFFPEKEVSSHA